MFGAGDGMPPDEMSTRRHEPLAGGNYPLLHTAAIGDDAAGREEWGDLLHKGHNGTDRSGEEDQIGPLYPLAGIGGVAVNDPELHPLLQVRLTPTDADYLTHFPLFPQDPGKGTANQAEADYDQTIDEGHGHFALGYEPRIFTN